MCGWAHLPRYIDKIRLNLTGKLHQAYQENFGTGFDGAWLRAAGLTHEQFIEVVRGTLTDGQVCDWVLKNVKRSEEQKKTHAESLVNYPKPDDNAMKARLKMRKEQADMSHRDDIQCFVDFIDADEGRL
jgi:hypothetical protein